MENFNKIYSREAKQEIIQLLIEQLDWIYDEQIGDLQELHHKAYNENYFIVGTYQAKKWVEDNFGVFEAIEAVIDYEKFNFGEVITDISSPERLVNMLVYIVGEELIGLISEDMTSSEALEIINSL